MQMAAVMANEESVFFDQWLAQLYYVEMGQGYKSKVISKSFFISDQGSTEPKKELEASLKHFRDPVPPGVVSPQCRYPGRYAFLRKNFELPEPVKCPSVEAWLERYGPTHLEIVYTSPFIANPASVFGHSFVLVPSTMQPEGFWMTFNFAAAMPGDVDVLSYIWGGLNGWFVGEYTVQPFYQRKFQYGHIENRDLWRYKLKLSADELKFALLHFWEVVHNARFTYYFLDENCAGVLQRSFAAILPELKRVNSLPPYIHPIKVIKTLRDAGRIQDVSFEPSQFNVVRDQLEGLSSEQMRFFWRASQGGKLDDRADYQTAEAVIEYTEYRTLQNEGKLPEELRDTERSAYQIRARSRNKPKKFALVPDERLQPHLSHDSYSLDLGVSKVDDRFIGDFGVRFAIHAMLDREAGYLANSALGFMDIKLSTAEGKVWLQNFDLLRMENIQPLVLFDVKPSWRVSLQVQENLLTPAIDDHLGLASGAFGYGVGRDSALLYLMFGSDLVSGKELESFYLGPELGFLASVGELKVQLSGQLLKAPSREFEPELQKYSAGIRWALANNLSLLFNSFWLQTNSVSDRNRHRLAVRYHF